MSADKLKSPEHGRMEGGRGGGGNFFFLLF